MEGKRTARPEPRAGKKGGKGKAAAGGLLALLVILAAAYLSLCIWVSRQDHSLLNNTQCLGVDLSGMTQEEARQAVDDAFHTNFGARSITLSCQGKEVFLPYAVLELAEDWVPVPEYTLEGVSFLAGGWAYLTQSASLQECGVAFVLSEAGEDVLDSALSQLESALGQAETRTTYEVNGDALLLHKGETCLAFDRAAAAAAVCAAVNEDPMAETVEAKLELTSVAPEALDLDLVYAEIYREPQDAAMDGETFEIVPETVGVKFDVEAAWAALTAAAEGETVSVPLIYTQPALSAAKLESLLFRDVLGSYSTTVSGTSNRVSNVSLAASSCNGVILVPGGEFSYNDVVGQRTTARGYLPAPAYNDGATVDEVGGGICQVSSTIYAATLLANLETVERYNHSYVSSYIGLGLDATVSWGGPNFRFRNNTDYPIQIVATKSGSTLTVQILGTKTEEFSVKMEVIPLSTTPYETIEQEDPTLEPGTTKVKVSGYTGKTCEVYRCLYDGDGNLVSRTFEHKDVYKVRNKVVLVGPAVETTEPVVPIEPTTPEAPTTPTEPVEPAEPTAPTEPAVPAEPTQPTDPVTPAEPDPGAIQPGEETEAWSPD